MASYPVVESEAENARTLGRFKYLRESSDGEPVAMDFLRQIAHEYPDAVIVEEDYDERIAARASDFL